MRARSDLEIGFSLIFTLCALSLLIGMLFDAMLFERMRGEKVKAEVAKTMGEDIPAPEEWCGKAMERHVMTQYWQSVWIERSPRPSEREGYAKRYYIRKGDSTSALRVLETQDKSEW